ncbi:MAG: adenine nucleotide alpha hydrolase [Candidatus Hydrogenedentota bacterium]|nr:MAG: adenine nucleotide alpha hydrolase [Candidatus Hydrogenedentota bacterium]
MVTERTGERTAVALVSSGGKDSLLALEALRRNDEYDVRGLVVTIAEPFQRVSHHGVREELLDLQAEALGLPLHKVFLPGLETTNEIYEDRLGKVLLRLAGEGISAFAFGDLFLEEIRAYREAHLRRLGLTPIFPLWGEDTVGLARDFAARYQAWIACVDGRKLERSFAGRKFEEAWEEFPADVDPCGENGEFHTFVGDGPGFARPVFVKVGEVVERDVRFFAELVPSNNGSTAEET